MILISMTSQRTLRMFCSYEEDELRKDEKKFVQNDEKCFD